MFFEKLRYLIMCGTLYLSQPNKYYSPTPGWVNSLLIGSVPYTYALIGLNYKNIFFLCWYGLCASFVFKFQNNCEHDVM